MRFPVILLLATVAAAAFVASAAGRPSGEIISEVDLGHGAGRVVDLPPRGRAVLRRRLHPRRRRPDARAVPSVAHLSRTRQGMRGDLPALSADAKDVPPLRRVASRLSGPEWRQALRIFARHASASTATPCRRTPRRRGRRCRRRPARPVRGGRGKEVGRAGSGSRRQRLPGGRGDSRSPARAARGAHAGPGPGRRQGQRRCTGGRAGVSGRPSHRIRPAASASSSFTRRRSSPPCTMRRCSRPTAAEDVFWDPLDALIDAATGD